MTDIPLQDLPLEVKHILEKYAAHLDVHVVSEFIMIILAAILETVPEGKSNQSVPKAKVSHCLQQLICKECMALTTSGTPFSRHDGLFFRSAC